MHVEMLISLRACDQPLPPASLCLSALPLPPVEVRLVILRRMVAGTLNRVRCVSPGA